MKYPADFIFPLLMFCFQSLMVFPAENKPSEILTDSLKTSLKSPADSINQFNQFGSFGLFQNGCRATSKPGNYNLFASYSYMNFNGYRAHSNEFAHTMNLQVETIPSGNTKLRIIGYYLKGQENRPGSLTKREYEQNPYQADPRAVNRNDKRVTEKGLLDINYLGKFGKSLQQKFEISGYGKIENFIRSTREFKIISRYGLGLNASYSNSGRILGHDNEFIFGGNLYLQPERTEEYENFSGQKSDQIEQLKSEKTSNYGCYIADTFELTGKKFFLHLTGRYDQVIYNLTEETLPSRTDKKTYQAFTPELGLHYKITRNITAFTSYELSFKSPTDKELESFFPSYLYNQDLRAQTSAKFEVGVAGNLTKKDSSVFFRKVHFQALFYNSKIEHEIVAYEIYGDEFYRNADRTNRNGVELEGRLEIIKDLAFSVDWTCLNFIYKAYTANSIEIDTTGNIAEIYRDFSGKSEPGIPQNNLKLSLFYKYPAGKQAGLFAGVIYQYNSGLWVDDANSDRTNSYSLMNAVLGFEMKFGSFALSASGGINNIFDRIYARYTNINSADKRFYDAGAPRNYIGSVNLSYIF